MDPKFERVLFVDGVEQGHCYDIGPCVEDSQVYVWERCVYGLVCIAGPFDDKVAGVAWVKKLSLGADRTQAF